MGETMASITLFRVGEYNSARFLWASTNPALVEHEGFSMIDILFEGLPMGYLCFLKHGRKGFRP